MIFGTGARPTDPDPRDRGFSSIGIVGGGDADLDSDLTPYVKVVRNQGSSSSCGGQAFAGAIDITTSQSLFAADYNDPASALFLYHLAIRASYGAIEDGGIDARSVATVLRKHGTCDERLWPFDADRVLDAPGWDAIFGAAARRGVSYAFVRSAGETRIGELSICLNAGFPPVVGLDLAKSFFGYTGGTIEKPTGTVAARHFVVLVGRDRVGGRVKFLNSWGGWGERGYGWLSDEYVGSSWCWDPCVVYGFDRARRR